MSSAGLFSLQAEAEHPASGQVAGQPVEVIDSQQYDLGDRTITYNRIKTPVLQDVTPAPQPISVPSTPIAPQAAKDHHSVFIEAWAYDNGASELRWKDKAGEYIAWSSMNANHFRAMSSVETASAYYSFMASVSSETVSNAQEWNALVQSQGGPEEAKRSIPVLSGSTPYVLVQTPPGGATAEAQQLLSDLHTYYEANKVAIVELFNEVEAARLAQEQERLNNPPEKQDTVIHYFPIDSEAGGSQ